MNSNTLDLSGETKKSYKLQILPCRVDRNAKITANSRSYFHRESNPVDETGAGMIGSFRGRPLVVSGPVKLPADHKIYLLQSDPELKTHQKFASIEQVVEWNLRNCPQSNQFQKAIDFLEIADILHS